MILTGHQPNYLPYAGFFHKIALSGRFLVVDNVQFVKRGPFGWMHRNRIRTGGPRGWDWLSLPVKTKGRFTQEIREAEIDGSVPWGRKHWRAIEWNYRRAPFFMEYAGGFEKIYARPWKWFCDLSCALTELILEALGLDRKVERTSVLGITGQSTDLVLAMCRSVGADTYLSGIHGKDYLDPARFEREGVQLRFQEYRCPVYKQCWPGEFIPDLSVIDLLFNCGPGSREVLTRDREA